MAQDSTQTQITGLTCPNCGKPITEKEIFCRYCGGSLPRLIPKVAETQQAGAGKIPVEPQPAAIARGNSASLACLSCGKSVAGSDIFCRHCGGSLARLVVHEAVSAGLNTQIETAGQTQAVPEQPQNQPEETLNAEAAAEAESDMAEPDTQKTVSEPKPATVGTVGQTLRICPNCKLLVWPKADGTCPSCQYKIQPAENAAAAIAIQSVLVEEEVSHPGQEQVATTGAKTTGLVAALPDLLEARPEAALSELPTKAGVEVAPNLVAAPIPSNRLAGVKNKPQAVTKPAAQVQQSVQYKVRLHTGETKFFDSVKTFREAILQGTITKSLETWTITIAQDGKRKESKESTVEKIAASNAVLRSLYRPIWDYTIKFISYGAMVCIGLKALDTTVTVFKVSALIGVFWLAVVGLLFLGKKWPAAPFVVIVASVMFGLKVNLFLAVLATMLVGFIFGAPLGMIVGTLVGYFRRKSRALAPDAEPEGLRPFLLGVFLPVVALAILIPVYLWLNVSMAKWVF